MHYFMTHGALNTRAIFYPAIVNPVKSTFFEPPRAYDSIRIHQPVTIEDLTDKDLLLSKDLRFVVDWSPITFFKYGKDAGVALSESNTVDFSSSVPISKGDLKISVLNSGGDAKLTLTYVAEGVPRTVTTTVPAHKSGWVVLAEGLPEGALQNFTLKLAKADSRVYMRGLRLDDTTLNWPWGQRASLTFHVGGANTQTLRFDPDDLLPIQGMKNPVRILDDSGSTVLGEFLPSN
jgi:hypothetical protein